MILLSTSINSLGLILLTHAVYSAHEHSSLHSTHASLSTASASPTAQLPLDIILELLVAVLIVCIGVVLAAPALKPIRWSVWAGKVEKDERREPGDGNGNPFRGLEERRGFLDVRGLRKEFADWVRQGAKG
ncbi:uncharacterized protein K441DRAFT_362800 [Cenococcum geophilum 1.58]|uniref:uncharacterized protein n=1 Tax=Cenococcum geophilum 1.58 TaxID=794803 RepID=UPI00358E184B|nr:hypothetical protein K441DRAFT_362800 [Cenococcum geophilum 1.58]